MEIVRVLSASPTAPAEARSSLVPLSRSVPPDRLDDLLLVVSELVTNSVLHAGLREGEPITLSVEGNARRVRVEVVDRGHGFTNDRGRGPTAPSEEPTRGLGRGLPIVARLADRWGIKPGSRTKVWAELSFGT